MQFVICTVAPATWIPDPHFSKTQSSMTPENDVTMNPVPASLNVLPLNVVVPTEILEKFGATPTSERVVEHLDRRVITAAGVSSGIDMALRLVEVLYDRVAAEACQLMIEYDPQPPFDAGATWKVGDEVMTRIGEYATLRE